MEIKAKIPVVNFCGLEDMKPGSSSWLSLCEQVCNALEEYGCFVAKFSDEVSYLELHTNIIAALDELFDFPKEIKVQNSYDKPTRGFYTANPSHESLGIDNPTNPQETQNFANIFWPQGNHHFCEIANSYAKLMEGLNQIVTRMIFHYYGVHQKYCDSLVGSTDYILKFHKYKPHKVRDGVGLLEHTDLTLNAIINQNHINGLEIKTKDGQWIGFDPSAASFIFLAGDGFQAWSNNRIRACMHRVTMNGEKARYSIVFFTFCNGTITSPKELVDEQHPLCYKPLNHYEYLAEQMRQKHRVSLVDFCGL
ncbi:hypothetical protein UlMin_011110 [Ulmus minor]